MAASTSFFDRLAARAAAIDSLLCVGLDPHSADLPAGAASADVAVTFCKRIIDATAPYAAAYKPNAAFFEVFGAAGAAALREVIDYIHAINVSTLVVPGSVSTDSGRIPVVLDAKRGDISTTAEAYASACYTAMDAECVTLSGYMGVDSLAPFTAHAGHGVFVLCKTSNASSNELQALRTSSGEAVYEVVARLAASTWNAARNVGLVVGATDTAALAAVRRVAPSAWILAPGVGFQGGSLHEALAASLRDDGSGVLLPVSRGISRASDMAAAARDLRDAINVVRHAHRAVDHVPSALRGHEKEFLLAAAAAGVLRFGEFTLKSGRLSPYFFNAGNFSTGGSLAALGRTYAQAIVDSGVEFDVLFGPAYKGIPLVTAAATALALCHGRDVPIAYNRKEAKDHGEGGVVVGASIAGKRVLIVDDVITAGTAIGEAVGIIEAAGGSAAGVIIGLDRQEVGATPVGADAPALSAVRQVEATYKIRVTAVVTLASLIAFITDSLKRGAAIPGLEGMTPDVLLDRVRAYREKYGVSA